MLRKNSGRASAKLSMWLAVVFAVAFPIGLRWVPAVSAQSGGNVNVTNTVSVSGSVSPSPLTDATASGTLTGSGTLTMAVGGYHTVSVSIPVGTWSAGNISVMISLDGTTYQAAAVRTVGGTTTQSQVISNVLPFATYNLAVLLPQGAQGVQLQASSITGTTGTAVIRASTVTGNSVGLIGYTTTSGLIGQVSVSGTPPVSPGPVGDTTVSGTITGSGVLGPIALAGYTGCSFSIPVGTWSAGNITVQASYDGGLTFSNVPVCSSFVASTAPLISTNVLSFGTYRGFVVMYPGVTHVQLTASSITGTTGTATLKATVAGSTISVVPSFTNVNGQAGVTAQLAAGSAAIGSLTAGSAAIGHPNGATATHISTDTTTTCKSGAGVLHTVNVNTLAATGTITIYDNTAGSGTVLAIIGGGVQTCYLYDISFATGCTIVTATAAPDITVCTYLERMIGLLPDGILDGKFHQHGLNYFHHFRN